MKINSLKRICSFLLAIMMVLPMLAVPIAAGEGATISIGSYTATVGDTVVVTMSLQGNPGIAGLTVTVKYDAQNLALTETKNGTVFSDFIAGKNLVFSGVGNTEKNGTLVTLTFTVLKAGEHSVECLVRECYNEGCAPVAVSSIAGCISATAPSVTPEAPSKVTFLHNMYAFLLLESEVKLGVGYYIEEMENIDPAAIADRFGLLLWNADEVPNDATHANCDNILAGAVYSTAEQRFETVTAGIAAKNLGDRLAFRAYYRNDDGSYSYSRLIESYSPKIYCYNQIDQNADDPSAVELMVAILNYGAAAQEYFGYNTDDLMNAGLTDAQKAMTWDDSLVRSDYSVPNGKDSAFVRDGGITSRGGYLNLNGAIDYNFYARTDFAVKTATVYYWTEAEIATLDALTLANASASEAMVWSDANGRWEAKYEGMAAKEMFETVYACMVFEDTDGTLRYSGVVGYSPERFSAINCNAADARTAALAKRIAIYGDAARAYFG